MALNLIGIGLSDEKDITVKGLEIVKASDVVYLENYTSILNVSVEKLEEFYSKKIILADRELVEQKADIILKDAETKNVSFLVVGDALSATTHIDLVKRAKEKNIEIKIIHNASILTAVGKTGLQLYKFGKTTSMPFPEENFAPETAYEVIKENQKNNLHTLVLLDLRPQENKFMTANQAIKILLEIQEKRKENILEKIIVCARIGSKDEQIVYGEIKDLKEKDFGKPIHCLIIPGKLHFAEEEFLV